VADYVRGVQPGRRAAVGSRGFSLGKLREMAEHEKEAAVEGAARQENQPVKCPFCAHIDDKVIDSREGRIGDTIRRRRRNA